MREGKGDYKWGGNDGKEEDGCRGEAYKVAATNLETKKWEGKMRPQKPCEFNCFLASVNLEMFCNEEILESCVWKPPGTN